MITLKKLIGSLMHELSEARTMSDISTNNIAKKYERHEVLRHFPIPRMTIADLDINLKFALDLSSNRIVEAKKRLLDGINDYVKSIPKADFAKDVFNSNKDLIAKWNDNLPSLMKEIEQVFPDNAVDSEKLSLVLTSIIESYFLRLFFHLSSPGFFEKILKKYDDAKQDKEKLYLSNFRKAIAAKLEEIIANTCERPEDAEADDLPSMNILVEAKELETIPIEKINSINIRISSADRQLVKLGEEGEEKTMLSPY
ncbi:MAG: hypothetical protein GY737_02495 [Desulfobacteraceae bacterium]|nr:hypothetical protein [Desulfobacteraceae bacterium]